MAAMIGCSNVGFLRIIGFRHPFSHCPRLFSSAPLRSSHQYPDVPALANSAQISLTPEEVEDFAPKIRQVVDWFGQLQAIDLECYQPSFRADTENDPVLSEDSAVIFEKREAILAEVPSYDKPYIKVPKVINKD